MLRHCTGCGARLTERPIDGRVRKFCPACDRVHWENPVPAVGAIVVRDGKVLLCERGRDPKKGQWDLPGGFLEVQEGPEEALKRELAEETGMTVRKTELVSVLPGEYGDRSTLNLIYRVEAQGEPLAMDDVASLRWFPVGELPSLAWPHEAAALRKVVEAGRPPAPPREAAKDVPRTASP